MNFLFNDDFVVIEDEDYDVVVVDVVVASIVVGGGVNISVTNAVIVATVDFDFISLFLFCYS